MKIIHTSSPMSLTGSRQNVMLSCREQARRGHQVSLVVPGNCPFPEPLAESAAAEGYRLIRLDGMYARFRLRDIPRGLRAMRQCLQDLSGDVVHSHGLMAGVLTRLAGRWPGGPAIVHTIHGPPSHRHMPLRVRLWANRLERMCARRTDALVAVSAGMARWCQEHRIARAERFTVIYSGLDERELLDRPSGADDFRRRLNLPDGAILVTQASRINAFKGVDHLLRAAERLPPSVHFCIAGGGDDGRSLQRRAEEMGLADRLHFPGWLDRAELSQALHASDVVVSCGMLEALGRSILEGMMAGKPVVCFRGLGTDEVFPDGETGIVVPTGDSAELARAIARLAGDAALRARMGQAGREWVRKKFSLQEMIDRLDKLYAGVLLMDRVPPPSSRCR